MDVYRMGRFDLIPDLVTQEAGGAHRGVRLVQRYAAHSLAVDSNPESPSGPYRYHVVEGDRLHKGHKFVVAVGAAGLDEQLDVHFTGRPNADRGHLRDPSTIRVRTAE
jgi:hypothetical protein